jgi:Kef-type K+ transport system membrane component KefB
MNALKANEALLFLVLLQLGLIIGAGYLGRRAARLTGQAQAAGEIILGLLLGPSLFGWLWPGGFHAVFAPAASGVMYAVSQVGLVLLLFQVGLEFDFSRLAELALRKAVNHIALASLMAPFALGFASGLLAAPALCPHSDRVLCALFIATALSITALPILGRILIEFDLTAHPLGVVAISAAAINDVVGWLLLAVVSALGASAFQFDLFAWRLLGIAAVAVFGFRWLRPALKRRIALWRASQSGGPPALTDGLLTLLLLTILISAVATHTLGIFPIFGAFLAGALIHDELDLRRAWREGVGQFVAIFFLPIFFTYTGLRTDIGSLDGVQAWAWCLVFLGIATLGKFGAAYIAARSCGWSVPASSAVGILMNTRALMELIVLNVGLDLDVISRPVFTMLVIMAVVSTVVTTPVLRLCLKHMPQGRVDA